MCNIRLKVDVETASEAIVCKRAPACVCGQENRTKVFSCPRVLPSGIGSLTNDTRHWHRKHHRKTHEPKFCRRYCERKAPSGWHRVRLGIVQMHIIAIDSSPLAHTHKFNPKMRPSHRSTNKADIFLFNLGKTSTTKTKKTITITSESIH